MREDIGGIRKIVEERHRRINRESLIITAMFLAIIICGAIILS